MARDGKNGGSYLSREELATLVGGMNVTESDIVSRLGVPLEAHRDLLVQELGKRTGLYYYGPEEKPFLNSGSSSYFHIDRSRAFKEKDRYGVSFYPNLLQTEVNKESTPSDEKSGTKTERNFRRPTIVGFVHGDPSENAVMRFTLDPAKMTKEELDVMMSHSLLKAKDATTGQTRDLTANDLIIKDGKSKTGVPWRVVALSADVEYDKESIKNIQRNFTEENKLDRVKAYEAQFVNHHVTNSGKKRDFQKRLAMDMSAALVQQAVYEKAYPRDQEHNRFSVYRSTYLDRATKDTLKYGIGNLSNTWEQLYRRGSVILASELGENEPLGKFFINAMEKAQENLDANNSQTKNHLQTLKNLKDTGGTFVVFEKVNEENEVHKVIQRLGSIKAPHRQTVEDTKEKRFIAGGGGLDGHYVPVLGSVNPNDDVKPPQAIFILEGIKTAVDFAAALDIKDETDKNNTTVVLSAGSSDNLAKVAGAMAALHENAQIVMVADNDYRNAIGASPEANAGVHGAFLATKEVQKVRQGLGVHPNTTFIVPPAIDGENTDIADIREYIMARTDKNIIDSLNNANAQNNNLGVKVNDEIQARAKAYAGRGFVENFGRTVANMVNSGLQEALAKGEVYHAPTFEPAKLETVQNIDRISPLPATYGKARAQPNPEASASRVRVADLAQKQYNEIAPEMKSVHPAMWSHRGFAQQFNEKGELTSLKEARTAQKIASMTHLIVDAMKTDHPLHETVKAIGIDNYKQANQQAPLDYKNTAYGGMLLAWGGLSNVMSSPKMPEDLKADVRQGMLQVVIGALSTDPGTTRDTIEYMVRNKQEPEKAPLLNTSTTLLAMAQTFTNDITENSLTEKRGRLPKLHIEDRVYNHTVDVLQEKIGQIPEDKLAGAFTRNETRDHVIDSIEFSKQYTQILRNNEAFGLEYKAYGRQAEELKNHDEENALRERHQSYEKVTERVQNELLAGGHSGNPKALWSELKKQHPLAKESIKELAEDNDSVDGVEFAGDKAATHLYKQNPAPMVSEEYLSTRPTVKERVVQILNTVNNSQEMQRDMSQIKAQMSSDSTNEHKPVFSAAPEPAPSKPVEPTPTPRNDDGPSLG